MSVKLPAILIIFLLCQIGCKSSNKDVKQIVKELSGKTISFDWPKQFVMYDTLLIIESEYSLTPAKIIKYIDNSFCPSCINNYLSLASDFITFAGKTNLFNSDSVEYYVILSRPKEEVIECFQDAPLSHIVLISDIEDKFLEENSLSGYDNIYTTFLLDKRNKIIGIGDPMLSVGVRDMYIKRIKELLE